MMCNIFIDYEAKYSINHHPECDGWIKYEVRKLLR